MQTAHGCWLPPATSCPLAPQTPTGPAPERLSSKLASAFGDLLKVLTSCPALAAEPDYANAEYAPFVLQLGVADQELSGLLEKFGWCGSRGFTRTLDLKGLQDALQKWQYIRIAVIGKGAYGTVHRAVHRITHQLIAIKQVAMTESGLGEAAVREITTLRELRHTNIVRLVEVMASHRSRYAYLVMELLDTDLHALLQRMRGARLDRAVVKSLMFQVLSGLQHAHSHSIMHRDLKPQNILIGFSVANTAAATPSAADTAAGYAPAAGPASSASAKSPFAVSAPRVTAKIADFGLARPYLPEGPEERAYTDWVMTLYYRAPEVLLGSRRYGPAVDVWSAGCCLAEMLNAMPLFRADCEIALLQDVFSKLGTPGAESAEGLPELARLQGAFQWYPPQPITQLVPALYDDSLGADLLKRMLSIDPSARITASQALQHAWFDDVRELELAAAAMAPPPAAAAPGLASMAEAVAMTPAPVAMMAGPMPVATAVW